MRQRPVHGSSSSIRGLIDRIASFVKISECLDDSPECARRSRESRPRCGPERPRLILSVP